MIQRWKIKIEYDGMPYSGWQIQDNAMTVQQAIEEAVEKFVGKRITIQASGRTDSGVHALGQVAHFDLEKDFEPHSIRDATNFHLSQAGERIAITHAEKVAPNFNARFDAFQRRYCYLMTVDLMHTPILNSQRSWYIRHDLDVEKMNEAAQFLQGTHDFSTFRTTACQAKSPIRTIDEISVYEVKDGLYSGKRICLDVKARSFLHHQIRNIAGTLKMVGEGKWSIEDVKKALEAKDRTKGGENAPPYALYFMSVEYPESE